MDSKLENFFWEQKTEYFSKIQTQLPKTHFIYLNIIYKKKGNKVEFNLLNKSWIKNWVSNLMFKEFERFLYVRQELLRKFDDNFAMGLISKV
jgi:hypothetical protein